MQEINTSKRNTNWEAKFKLGFISRPLCLQLGALCTSFRLSEDLRWRSQVSDGVEATKTCINMAEVKVGLY